MGALAILFYWQNGRCKAVAQVKGFGRRALLAQLLKALNRFFYRRVMALRHPPQHHVSLWHGGKPLFAAAYDAGVVGFVDELLQRLGVGPYRQVDERAVAQGAHGGGVALWRLKAPHKTRRRLGQRVDAVEVGHKVGQEGRVERLAQGGDVELGQVVREHRCP